MPFSFTQDRNKRAEALLVRYPHKRATLLPLLWLVQEQEGWVSLGAASVVARMIGITEAEVMEVVSFYTLFNRKPKGIHHIQICAGVCCRLRGSDWLLSYIKEKLSIDVGETTSDGRFHLSTVECLGSCGTSPMMQIGDDYHENLDAKKVDGILATLQK